MPFLRHLARIGQVALGGGTKGRYRPLAGNLRPYLTLASRQFTPSYIRTRALSSAKSTINTIQRSASTAIHVSNIVPKHDSRTLEVKWDIGGSDKYPYIWLRDNCQCPECYHTSSRNRVLLIQDLELSVTPVSIKTTESGKVMDIQWSDGHQATYGSEWLHARAFEKDRREKRLGFIETKHTYWIGKDAQNLPKESYQEVMEQDEPLLRILKQLEEYGIVILHSAPCEGGQVKALTDRIGYCRRSPDGETFSVKSKVGAHNLAYTAKKLDFHVDYAHLESKPGVQILHCIAQTNGKGGETQFVDGFRVANQLRDLHPEKFDILANTPVDYKDEGVMEQGLLVGTIFRVPMICLDQFGSIKGVVTSNLMRDTFFCTEIDQVEPWYEAMLTFHQLIGQEENIFSYKLNEGDIAVFDNTRVLHARTAFKVESSPRVLEGTYMDWDQIKSRRRVLQLKLDG